MTYEEELDRDFPKLYRDCYCGIWVPTGWQALVRELSSKLEPICADQPELYAVQVKEKFGGLRFYMSEVNETAELLIRHAEELSLKACTECGNPSELFTHGGWRFNLCQKHKEELLDS